MGWDRVYQLEAFPEGAKCVTCVHGLRRESRLPPPHPVIVEHMRECGIDPAAASARLRTIYCGQEHQIVWWSPQAWDESGTPCVVEECSGYRKREASDPRPSLRFGGR